MPSDEEIQFVAYSCLVVATTIVAYDTCLTFSREVESIWRRKSSAVTILFFTQRYVLLVTAIVRLCNPRQIGPCKAVNYIQFVTQMITSAGVATFSALRVWAICGRINAIVTLVFLCGIFDTCINIYNYSRPKTFFIDFDGCELMIASIPIDE